MATASELISNQGSPGLGLGSNVGIPVSTNDKLDAVNEAGRTAMLVNIDQQNKLYQQKVKEHDQLLNLLQSGDLKIGDHLDRDTTVLHKALDELDAAYFNRAKKGFNDLDAAREYNKKLREANETVTQAQARYVVDKKVQQDAANEPLPSDRDNILKNHDSYLGKFWNDYKPAVKAFTLDHPGMTNSILREALVPNSGISTGSQATTKFTTKTLPNGKTETWNSVTNKPATAAEIKASSKGSQTAGGGLSMFNTVPGKFYDYNKMVANAADDFHDEKQRLNQTKYMDYVLNQTADPQLSAIVDQANSRIKTYNEQRGITDPNQPGYVTPLDIVIAPDGSRHTNLSVPEFNAKMALASIPGDYVEKDKQVIDKDAANYLIGKEKADTDAFYKRAMAAAANTRAGAYAANLRQQMKLRDTDTEKDQFLDEMYKRNLVQQSHIVDGDGSGKVGLVNVQAQQSLPVFTLDGKTPKQLIPIDAKPVYSPDSYDSHNVLKVGSKPLYYKGGYFKPTYRIGGAEASNQKMVDIYNNFKSIQGKKWQGSYDDFLKQAIQSGDIKVLLTGANGTTDEELSRAAQRIISNTSTKKGQDAVFSPEYNDEQIPDSNQ